MTKLGKECLKYTQVELNDVYSAGGNVRTLANANALRVEFQFFNRKTGVVDTQLAKIYAPDPSCSQEAFLDPLIWISQIDFYTTFMETSGTNRSFELKPLMFVEGKTFLLSLQAEVAMN